MQRWFIPHRLHELLIQVGIAGLVYAQACFGHSGRVEPGIVGHLGANEEDEVTLAVVGTYQDEA